MPKIRLLPDLCCSFYCIKMQYVTAQFYYVIFRRLSIILLCKQQGLSTNKLVIKVKNKKLWFSYKLTFAPYKLLKKKRSNLMFFVTILVLSYKASSIFIVFTIGMWCAHRRERTSSSLIERSCFLQTTFF